MNTLILSCNTGEGHNSCAAALKITFEAHGENCDIADALRFISTGVSRLVSNWHVRLYRYMPNTFDHGYRFAEQHPSFYNEKSGVYKILSAGSERLYQLLQEKQYDTIICTHVFGSLMVTNLLKNHPLTLRTAFIATDYTCTPGAEDISMDYYCIPDVAMKEEFVRNGIPEEKIVVTGIPVAPAFLERTDKEEAKRQLGIAAHRKHLLMMCGSMGCGPMTQLANCLIEYMPEDMEVTIICGTNERLYKALSKQAAECRHVHILGYTNQVSLLMDSADLYLTKPGGISVTEAAVKALPMAFINAVAGCEEPNLHFFVEMGAAVADKIPEELAKQCIQLLHDEEKLRQLGLQLEKKAFGHGSDNIYSLMSGDKVVW